GDLGAHGGVGKDLVQMGVRGLHGDEGGIVRGIGGKESEELAEYINTLGWNRPAFYDDDDDDDVDYTIAITPVLSTEEPDNSLNKIIWDLKKAPDSPHLHTFSSNQRHCFHCKDVLGDGESCQRCTCTRCGSGIRKGLCYICGNNQNSLNDSPSISENSSQSPPHINHHCCYECDDALDGIFCQQCTCKSCGKGAHIGYNCPPKVLIIFNPEPCNQTMNNKPPQTFPSFDPTCYCEKGNSLPCVSKPNLVDESPNVFNPPPQPPIYSCEFCGSNAKYRHYCTPQVLFIYPELGYSQDLISRKIFMIFNNSISVVISVGARTRLFNVLLLAWDRVFEIKDALGNKQYKPEDIQELFCKLLNNVQNIHEELAEYINTLGWNRHAFYNNDDDDDASKSPFFLSLLLGSGLRNGGTVAGVLNGRDETVILKSLEVNFSEFMRTNQSPEAVSNIPGIVHQYMHQEMTEAVRDVLQIQTNRLQDSLQRENDEFLRTIDDNMKKIIKEQVKSQVKAQVTRILPRIEESVNAQLEAEVLTRSSHSSRTSYVVAADLSEMELKKILIDKMEGNKSIQLSDEQRTLYKALVEAYEADKIILNSYRESAILKRIREDDDDQEGPSAGSDRGSKRRREGGEHALANTPSEPATMSADRSTTGTQSRQLSASESAFAEEPMQTPCQMEEPSHPPRKPPTPDRDWNKTLPAVQGNAQSWISVLVKQTDARSSFNELLDTLIDFSNFIMNRIGVDTLTPELLAGPTYELMRGSCNSLTDLEYHLEEVYKATTDQLDWVNPEGQQYPHNLLQPLSLIPDNRGRHVIPFEHFINNDLEYLWGGALSQKYTTSVTKTMAADYGHIKFVVNPKSALDVYSKRRIIAVTDLKIVEWHNYKHLDWISDVYEEYRHSTAYGRSSTGSRKLTEEAQPYKAKHDKKNRLMRIDELNKFSDRTLNDVCNALDDRPKGNRMQYLPTTIWRKGDKDRPAAMIQAIDKMLKTRRIIRSLERFVGGRQYEGDF
nr:hypothetical protein [Tanacetum cinerariifolium]